MLTFVLAATALASLGPEARANGPKAPMRGVIVTCPGWGPIWGTPEMATSLAEIKELGANWAAIHPYGWIRRDGEVRFQPAETLDFLARAVELTREAGLEMFWKPHLGYWGQFSWRGEITFDEGKAWERFFGDYEAFLVDQARFAEARGIRLFAVGVELEGTTHREREWRALISEVRRVYSGRILYAANWDRLDRVPFWDAVDAIGVHAYFPLIDGSAGETGPPPARATLADGWNGPLTQLEALSAKHEKPIVLAEIGYNVNATAAAEPWAYRVENTADNRALRRRLMEVAIERIEKTDFIEGMFWWKWMPGRTPWRGNFSLRDPEARAALARYWRPDSPAAAPLPATDR